MNIGVLCRRGDKNLQTFTEKFKALVASSNQIPKVVFPQPGKADIPNKVLLFLSKLLLLTSERNGRESPQIQSNFVPEAKDEIAKLLPSRANQKSIQAESSHPKSFNRPSNPSKGNKISG